MATERTIRTNAENKVMTLGELRRFVREMDTAGAADATPIAGKITWRGGLQQVRADVVHFATGRPAPTRQMRGNLS